MIETDKKPAGVVYAPYIPITTGTIYNGVCKEYKTEEELHQANPQLPLDIIEKFLESNKSL